MDQFDKQAFEDADRKCNFWIDGSRELLFPAGVFTVLQLFLMVLFVVTKDPIVEVMFLKALVVPLIFGGFAMCMLWLASMHLRKMKDLLGDK
jgi:hypothetical protein